MKMKSYTLGEAWESIQNCKSHLDAGELLIIKNVVDSSTINRLKHYLVGIGTNSLGTYVPVEFGAPNHHRIVNADPRSHVKGQFHQFSFFPWNQDPFNLFPVFNNIFQLKNKIAGFDENYLLSPDADSDSVPRLSFQFYPSGGGFLTAHRDPVGAHQLHVFTLCMSEFGKDYQDGGVYFQDGTEKIFPEKLARTGDVFVFNAQMVHGVDPIDPAQTQDWLSFRGRWMMIFAINAVQSKNLNVVSEEATNEDIRR